MDENDIKMANRVAFVIVACIVCFSTCQSFEEYQNAHRTKPGPNSDFCVHVDDKGYATLHQ